MFSSKYGFSLESSISKVVFSCPTTNVKLPFNVFLYSASATASISTVTLSPFFSPIFGVTVIVKESELVLLGITPSFLLSWHIALFVTL